MAGGGSGLGPQTMVILSFLKNFYGLWSMVYGAGARATDHGSQDHRIFLKSLEILWSMVCGRRGSGLGPQTIDRRNSKLFEEFLWPVIYGPWYIFHGWGARALGHRP